MATLSAVIVGCLYAAGIYMMLRRSLFKLILGLVLLSHGANLLIFTVGGLTRGQPPVAPPGADAPPAPHADPLPQALILTAIVIGFAVLAFSLALFHRGYQSFGSDDPDDLKVTDR
jgi:multicomponent Na+:H+ antiporter subunit C